MMFKQTAAAGIILILLLTGCMSVEDPVTTESSGETAGWSIAVNGMRSDTVTEKDLDDSMAHKSHRIEMKLEKKGEVNTYAGIPLWMICAMADGPDSHHPYSFDRELWEAGYDITITASEGYSATFNTAEISPESIILTDTKDGKKIPPQTAGEVSGKLWVKDIASIDLSLSAVSEEKPFELIISVNGEESGYLLKDLEESPYYIEEMGSYTTSAGTTHTHKYGGIKFADFLAGFITLKKDTTVIAAAMDEYEISYSGEELIDESEGIWILAFKSDGEYLPMDPGFIRTVKVGPDTPNIDGHSSARMIAKIIISGESYKDFALTMHGKMDMVLDRKTIQTGISCHKTTVNYYNKKTDTTSAYTGIPLWCLLAVSDDPDYAPHKQDSSIISYDGSSAEAGYQVTISAADDFSITLDSRDLHMNDDVIIAMYKDGEELPEGYWPLMIVWDKDAALVPEGIKAVREIAGISLIFE